MKKARTTDIRNDTAFSAMAPRERPEVFALQSAHYASKTGVFQAMAVNVRPLGVRINSLEAGRTQEAMRWLDSAQRLPKSMPFLGTS